MFSEKDSYYSSPEGEKNPPIDKSETPEFVRKTLVGRNEENKRVVELSINDIEDMTGISREEMFGTEEGGERIAYIGAPWQALKVMDSDRMFVFDYEYGEIANFSENYDDLGERFNGVFYGEYSNGLQDYSREVSQSSDEEIQKEEKLWVEKAFFLAQEIDDIVNQLSGCACSDETRSKENLLLEKTSLLGEMIDLREKERDEIIQKREEERLLEGNEHAPYHPVEGFHKYLTYLVKNVEQGIQDIRDYERVVAPRLEEFERSLPSDLDSRDWEINMKIEKMEILNELRLQKRTEKSKVAVGIFPYLPVADESMDRLVCSYSISTHVIPEADKEDFVSWMREIQRVLKPGGRAYIFPMQQGFPFGRWYDEDSLDESLVDFSPERGGNLQYEYYENPDTNAWRQDTTLIITKES